MKKLNFWLLASLFAASFAVVACGDEEEPVGPNGGGNGNDSTQVNPNDTTKVPGSDAVTVNDLIGTWTVNSTDNQYVAVFTADSVTIIENGLIQSQEKYTVENGVVKFGNYMQSTPGLLYDKSVLVIKQLFKTEEGTEEMFGMILFKQGKEINTPKEDIQGQWCWYEETDSTVIIRTAIKFQGDNFEVIITPRGERYVGTYVYWAGMIKLQVTDAYTSREEGTGYGSLWGRMNPQTLECDDWRTLNPDHWHIDAVSHTPFIANGDEAYGFIANLPAILKLKK